MLVYFVIITCILVGLIFSLSVVGKVFEAKNVAKVGAFGEEEEQETKMYYKGAVALSLIAFLGGFYYFIQGTPYEGHFFEWLNLLVRWAHITIGIAWIGASFYFVFLENSLNRTKNLRDELAGNLWAGHGGGFYYLEKYKVAPKEIPADLHWFKYEAYFTWLTGFLLLWIVYYFNASGYLIDKNVLDIAPSTGIAIGIGSLILGWLIYDVLCKSPLLKKGPLFFLIFFLILVGFAWFYTHVFSARAAYIHVGALIGTCMAGNVFFVIIPSQKALVKAAKENLPLDPWLGKYAGLRSYHNNYFTLPVLFIMVSNHFPSTFGHEYNWAVLAVISLGSAALKHYLNQHEKGIKAEAWVLPVSVLLILTAAYITAPNLSKEKCTDTVTFNEVYPIFAERCTPCHSSKPTDDFYTTPF